MWNILPSMSFEREEEDMATPYYTIEGRGRQVWGYTGNALWRATTAEFTLAKKQGLKTPVPEMSKKDFDDTRFRLRMD